MDIYYEQFIWKLCVQFLKSSKKAGPQIKFVVVKFLDIIYNVVYILYIKEVQRNKLARLIKKSFVNNTINIYIHSISTLFEGFV